MRAGRPKPEQLSLRRRAAGQGRRTHGDIEDSGAGATALRIPAAGGGYFDSKRASDSGVGGGREFQAWCIEQKIEVVHTRPGKPVENAYCESFNGRLSEEFLNTTQFRSLFDARSWAGTWHKHYNEHRPHCSLNYRTPSESAAQTLAHKAKQLYDLAAT